MSNILSKAVATSESTADLKGGYLELPQVNTFIDYMWDKTVLGAQVRKEIIRGDSAELTRIGVGQRLLRVATEAVDDGRNVGARFAKISLSTTKFRLDWELSTESLEDGREGEAFEDHIARLLAAQVANDMEDYAINGNPTLSDDPGIGSLAGWSYRANSIANVYDAAGATLNRTVSSHMFRKLPRIYQRDRTALKVFASANALQDLLDSETALYLGANTVRNDGQVEGALGYQTTVNGFSHQEVPYFFDDKVGTYSGGASSQKIHGEAWLTDPQNLIWAVKREIQVYREFEPKKDSIEYTLYTRFGTAIEDGNAMVVAKNIKVV